METSYGIFFDLDGTLVDNEPLKARAFSEAIKQFGGESQPGLYKEVMGRSGLEVRKHFIKKANIQIDLDDYYRLFKSIYQGFLKTDLALKPGVVPFLRDIKSKGIKTALVSGAYAKSVHYITDTLQLNPYFDFILTGEDFIKQKPDPECYLLALQKIRLPKKQVLVFEDTEFGLQAAYHAGLKAIGIRHAYNQSHDFSRAAGEYASFEKDIENIKKNIKTIFKKDIF